MNAPCPELDEALKALGWRAVGIVGTAQAKDRARLAEAGELALAEALALAAEVQALAGLLGGRRG